LPEQPVEPVDGILASAVVGKSNRHKIGEPKRVIQLAHHQQTTVGTELRATKFQPHPAVKIHPITPLEARTLWMIHQTRPQHRATL
jgi:hypothetical protein